MLCLQNLMLRKRFELHLFVQCTVWYEALFQFIMITQNCASSSMAWKIKSCKRGLVMFLVFIRNSCIVSPTFCPTWPETELGLTYHWWQQSPSAQFRRMMWFWLLFHMFWLSFWELPHILPSIANLSSEDSSTFN